MSNLGITVNQLLELCLNQMEKGNGDKHVLISDDDEGNGYHTLFYGFTDKYLDRLLKYEHDGTHNADNCVILG